MKKKEIITFIIVFCVAILSTIFFLEPHYCIDTLEFLTNGYDSYIQSKFLVDGRIFSVLLLKLVIDMPMKYIIPILYVIGILISCVAVMYIRKWIIKYTKTEEKLNILPTIISYVIIFNFMYIDTFQFMEFPIIALSVLLFIVSAKMIVEKNKNYIPKSFMLALIAMFCYQGAINVFVATGFVFSIIDNKKLNRNVIKDILKIGIILLLTVGINYCFTEIVGGTDRIDFNLIDNLKNALIGLYLIIFNSGDHYPKCLQMIFVLIITIYCLVKKYKVTNLLYIYLVCIGVNIIVLTGTGEPPSIVMNQNGRIFISIGALIGYMLMYLWCTYEEIRNCKIMRLITIVYFVTILITYFQYTYMYMKGQEIDEYIINSIDQVISEYEEETGNKITKYAYTIAFENYEKLKSSSILNKKYNEMNYITIQKARLSTATINKVLFWEHANRVIERVHPDEDWEEKYFENIDFSELELFDERRFVFIDDTVYIML